MTKRVLLVKDTEDMMKLVHLCVLHSILRVWMTNATVRDRDTMMQER